MHSNYWLDNSFVIIDLEPAQRRAAFPDHACDRRLRQSEDGGGPFGPDASGVDVDDQRVGEIVDTGRHPAIRGRDNRLPPPLLVSQPALRGENAVGQFTLTLDLVTQPITWALGDGQPGPALLASSFAA